MFDILVYLFENYVHADACPEGEQLARKLSAAGFEEDEIVEAMEWFSELRRNSDQVSPCGQGNGAIRLFAPEELAHIGVECRGFLVFLENSGVLDGATRELIIERALALTEASLTLNRFKVIVLMVLWQQDAPMDSLILDELLSEEEDDDIAPLLH